MGKVRWERCAGHWFNPDERLYAEDVGGHFDQAVLTSKALCIEDNIEALR